MSQSSLASSPSNQGTLPGRAGRPDSALLQATAAATAASKSRPQLKVTTSQTNTAAVQPGPRRIWVKRAGMTPTSLLVEADDLVDDLKMKILAKYPTSLLRTCDPADLVVSIPGDIAKMLRTPASTASFASPSVAQRKLSSSSNSRPRAQSITTGKTFKSPLASPQLPSAIELEPDELIVPLIDKYFPDGMSMSEALDISPTSIPSGQSGTSSLAPAGPLSRAGSLATLSRARGPTSMAPPPLPSQTQTAAAAAAAAKPKLISSPSSTQLVKRAVGSQPEKKPTDQAQSAGASGGVLLLPRQLTLSMKKEVTADSAPVSPAHTETKDSEKQDGSKKEDQKQEGLLELRQMYKKLPSAQASVVVPQVNVLIVEDNEINQKILETALRRNKVRCSIAKNGRDAVAKWREGGFHIILMDLQLPVMSGLEASKEIRRLETVNRIGAFSATSDSKNPPAQEQDKIDHKLFKSPVIIVALTASSSAEDRSEALRAGCNDFLTKPVNLEWLQQKLLEWGCMQALIDFEGWKNWYVLESGTPKAGNSLFRKAVTAPSAPNEIPRPQSPRAPSVGRSGRALERNAPRSRSSSTRRSK